MTAITGQGARHRGRARRGRRLWLIALMAVALAVGCTPDELRKVLHPYEPKRPYFLWHLALSPTADRIVLVPFRHSRDTPAVPSRWLVLYDVAADTLTLLPPLEAGWFPGSVRFSSDGTRLATATHHGHLRVDRPFRSRIMLYDFPTGRWRTLTDAPVRHGAPNFVSDDRELLYPYDDVGSDPELALLDLATGQETLLTFLPEDRHRLMGAFSTIFDPQFRTPSEILFSAMGPNTARLKAYIRGGHLSVIGSSFLYRVPVERRDGRVRISGPVEFLSALNSIPEADFSHFWYLPQTRAMVCRSTVRTGGARLANVLYMVRDGQVVASRQTRLILMDLYPSADGQLIAFTGNPIRLVDPGGPKAKGRDLTELFLYDVATDTLRSISLTERVNNLLRAQ